MISPSASPRTIPQRSEIRMDARLPARTRALTGPSNSSIRAATSFEPMPTPRLSGDIVQLSSQPDADLSPRPVPTLLPCISAINNLRSGFPKLASSQERCPSQVTGSVWMELARVSGSFRHSNRNCASSGVAGRSVTFRASDGSEFMIPIPCQRRLQPQGTAAFGVAPPIKSRACFSGCCHPASQNYCRWNNGTLPPPAKHPECGPNPRRQIPAL